MLLGTGHEEELGGSRAGFAQRPAVVFAASSAADVAAAVAYAASAGLPVGVQSTGQGATGDRREGLYDAGTRKRPAEVKSEYDPANLFRRNYDITA